VNVIVVGAGGFGRECAHYIRDIERGSNSIRLKGFLDDDPTAEGDDTLGVPLLGPIRDHPISSTERYVVAVGDGVVRARVAGDLEARGGELLSVRHPTAWVASSALVGRHVILAPFSFVGPRARVDNHCAVNIYGSVGHDATVGEGTTVSPYATLNGDAVVGRFVFLGTGSVVTVGKSIGDGSKLSAGAVVHRDIPPQSLAVGSPARHREIYPRP
jgi:sugar O-acyltransferase (sialic acid O-acetyltransferase NeuD family)